MVAYTYKISPDQLAPQTLFELYTLIPYVKAEEQLREHWSDYDAEGIRHLATTVYGPARADELAARRAMQLQMAKMT